MIETTPTIFTGVTANGAVVKREVTLLGEDAATVTAGVITTDGTLIDGKCTQVIVDAATIMAGTILLDSNPVEAEIGPVVETTAISVAPMMVRPSMVIWPPWRWKTRSVMPLASITTGPGCCGSGKRLISPLRSRSPVCEASSLPLSVRERR